MEKVKAHNSTSGNIMFYGWEDNVLEVVFAKQRTYRYRGVPQALWQGLLRSPSAGAYLNSEIKPFYPAEKIQ